MSAVYFHEDVKELLHGKGLAVVGSSVQRSVYKDIVCLLQDNRYLTEQELRKKGEQSFMNDELVYGGVKGEMKNSIDYRECRIYSDSHLDTFCHYFFVARCYNNYVKEVIEELSAKAVDIIIMSSCLWDVHRYGGTNSVYETNLKYLIEHVVQQLPHSLFIWLTTPPVDIKSRGGFLHKPGQDLVKIEEVARFNKIARDVFTHANSIYGGFKLVDLECYFHDVTLDRTSDGVHWNARAHRHMTNMILEQISMSLNQRVPRFLEDYVETDHEFRLPKWLQERLDAVRQQRLLLRDCNGQENLCPSNIDWENWKDPWLHYDGIDTYQDDDWENKNIHRWSNAPINLYQEKRKVRLPMNPIDADGENRSVQRFQNGNIDHVGYIQGNKRRHSCLNDSIDAEQGSRKVARLRRESMHDGHVHSSIPRRYIELKGNKKKIKGGKRMGKSGHVKDKRSGLHTGNKFSIPKLEPEQVFHLVDGGVNLTNTKFCGNTDLIIARAIAAGVQKMVVTGLKLAGCKNAVTLSRSHPNVLYAAVGVHPHFVKDDWKDKTLQELEDLVKKPEVVAIGECGLDFNRNFSSRELQIRTFKKQVELAVRYQKALLVHARDSHWDVLDVLKGFEDTLPPVVIHCFTGSLEQIKSYVAKGFYIGVTGFICKGKAGVVLRTAIRDGVLPLKQIVLQTNAPYMIPNTPHDEIDPISKTLLEYCSAGDNEPCTLSIIVRCIAKCLSQEPKAIAAQCTENAAEIFRFSSG